MSYSLSQLDAIGDVDPVAEADVYLAYGRDLQAEEILKEAMRGNPERLAIRTKLLEVYAKRRDTKGFELLATQLFGLTRGDGEDWHKAQELGVQIDPENPLYQPGGRPAVPVPGGGRRLDRAARREHDAAVGAAARRRSFDLPAARRPSRRARRRPGPRPRRSTRRAAHRADEVRRSRFGRQRRSSGREPRAAADPASDAGPRLRQREPRHADFDLSEPVARPRRGSRASRPRRQRASFGDARSASTAATPATTRSSRKLELAEEFRQIGDTEGARDLLEEVVAKASGPLKTRRRACSTSSADAAGGGPPLVVAAGPS